jgi:hypothetical protein
MAPQSAIRSLATSLTAGTEGTCPPAPTSWVALCIGVIAAAGTVVLGGCSNADNGKAAASSSSAAASSSAVAASSSAAKHAADQQAAAAKACSTWDTAHNDFDNAEDAFLHAVNTHAPVPEAAAKLKAFLTIGQQSVAAVENAVTPDVSDPPAGALRAWIEAANLSINNVNELDPFLNAVQQALKDEDTVTGACKPFS